MLTDSFATGSTGRLGTGVQVVVAFIIHVFSPFLDLRGITPF